MNKITSFRGKYAFLSNFYPCGIIMDSAYYPSVECAFQAAKTLVQAERMQFAHATSAEAKRLGKKVSLRDDWSDVKLKIMKALIRQKFKNSKDLRRLLLETGDAELIEGNRWGDVFWGVFNGTGRNELGKTLMDVRSELNEQS